MAQRVSAISLGNIFAAAAAKCITAIFQSELKMRWNSGWKPVRLSLLVEIIDEDANASENDRGPNG